MDPSRIRLQPVRLEDLEYLVQLRRSTMREYIEATWEWNDTWQEADVRARFNPLIQSLILVDGVAAGFIDMQQQEGSLLVADIQVSPEYQGQGIGTALLRQILQSAKDSGRAVVLQVLEVNTRAKRLYERLGFHVTGFEPPHFQMRVDPL